MKILYASVNIYHHMIPLAKSIAGRIGDSNFKYAVLKPTETFRLKMGFSENSEDQKWVIKVYKDKSSFITFQKWFLNADVVMFSDRSLFNLAKDRLKKNKLTFYFSERWWKPSVGKWRLFHPRNLSYALKLRNLSMDRNFHYLAQGGYAAKDIRFISTFEKRIWNWGYFTDISENKATKVNKSNINIIWCGRLLRLKKVDSLIKAFALVLKENTNCHLSIIGDGIEKDKLCRLSIRHLPEWSYEFITSQSTEVIRKTMNSSDILVLPSSGYEGWGAVINEAMTEGCAVIASLETGGGRSIISHLKNGLLFQSGNVNELAKMILLLANNKKLLSDIKNEGKKTINELWSPEIASERLIKVCKAILLNEEIPCYKDGPMKQI